MRSSTLSHPWAGLDQDWSTPRKPMVLQGYHVYILASLSIPVVSICIFASYIIFWYDQESSSFPGSERFGCCLCCLRQTPSRMAVPCPIPGVGASKRAEFPSTQVDESHSVAVWIQHPDKTMDVGVLADIL